MHNGVTRPQRVNSLWHCDTIWRRGSWPILNRVMVAWRRQATAWTSMDYLSVIPSDIQLKAIWQEVFKISIINWYRAANQYGISVFCTDFTCKIREYEFGLENTEIELCQFCHLKYCCQNKAYLFWVANQSGFVAFYALEPSNTSLITKTFNLLSSTCSSNMLSCITSCSCSSGSIH